MLVVDGQKSERPWEHVLVDLRVDDAPDPIGELERLLSIQRAYDHMNAGDELLAEDKTADAQREYRQAAALAPQIDEIPFWQAVTLADSGSLDKALPIFRKLFEQNPNWSELVQRLPASGLLKDDPEMMGKILAER
jgi:tetratricopeptide (TPR) repeat protein